MSDPGASATLPPDSNKVRLRRIRAFFGTDPKGMGFYWPTSEQKRSEVLSVKRNSPSDFEAIYQGRPGAREGSVFLEADLNAFYALEVNGVPFAPTELVLGLNSAPIRAFTKQGYCVLQAWDTAFSTTMSSAWTVCVTALLVPCQKYHCGEDEKLLGPCEYHYDVLLLDVFRKRLDFAGLLPELRRLHILWNPQEIVIEKKASGIDAIAALKNSTLPIIPVTPRDGKRERAVNSVGLKTAGSVQGWFRQHRVLTPPFAHWLEKWRTELKDFSGSDDTSSDQVDATVHLITRAIIMGSSMVTLPTDWTPERSAIPAHLLGMNQPGAFNQADPRAVALSTIGALPELSEDPFWGTCSRCIHQGDKRPCPIQGRRMLAMDSCDHFSDTPDVDTNALAEAFRLSH